MSFGFSIGDIILLSGIAYDIYTSLSTGRKGASKDLKELEDVLFSLRCALDHLGGVAKDIPDNPRDQKAVELRENLDRMIKSCGLTLQELDSTTKKYREVVVVEENEKSKITEEMQTGLVKKKKTFESVKKRAVINWKKVRWDQEKHSLQQYREKLRSHTDAINIILNSIMWSNANSAEATSKTNHEKTHSLLNQVLATPNTDTSLMQLVQEIHSLLTKPKPLPELGPQLPLQNDLPKFTSAASGSGFKSPRISLRSGRAGSQHPVRSVAAANFATLSAGAANVEPVGASAYRISSQSNSLPTAEPSEENMLLRGKTLYEPSTEPSHDWTSHFSAPEANTQYVATQYASRLQKPLVKASQRHDQEPEDSLRQLNNERRAFAVKEFNAYKRLHPRPTPAPAKPAFLDTTVPGLKQMQSALGYVFRPLPEGRTDSTRAANEERGKEIVKWVESFQQYMISEDNSQSQVDLLVALNYAVESTDWRVKRLFYKAADQANLMGRLEGLQESSKSVRVMKEIEEFQDAREDFEEDLK